MTRREAERGTRGGAGRGEGAPMGTPGTEHARMPAHRADSRVDGGDRSPRQPVEAVGLGASRGPDSVVRSDPSGELSSHQSKE